MLKVQMQLPFEYSNDTEQQLTKVEKTVFDCIPTGKDHAISGHDIAEMVSLDERTIANIVRRLRLKHCDIGSSRSSAHYGYYRFKDAPEYTEYMQRSCKEQNDTEKVIDAMRFTPIAQQLTVSLEQDRKKEEKNEY